MYEIELKAWCDNRKSVETKLNDVATFKEHIEKKDEYWTANLPERKDARIRIREEIIKTSESTNPHSTFIATYKNKEIKNQSGNLGFELNDEKEFILDRPNDLRCFLSDIGFSITDVKLKSTDTWLYKIDDKKTATVEISDVSKLGTFIEIEILEQYNDEQTVINAKNILLKILKECGISENKIETRYYTEMLKSKELNRGA